MSAVIPTTSAGLIARAEHALRTNQPNLARTYLEAANTAKHTERAERLFQVLELRSRRILLEGYRVFRSGNAA